MYYVYILKLNNGTHYTGFTTNLRERVIDHNKGDVSHTKKFRPVKLVWYCTFGSKIKALQFEKYLKSGSGIAFRNKRLIQGVKNAKSNLAVTLDVTQKF